MSRIIQTSNQLEFFDATHEAELYHPDTGGGFFSLLYQHDGRKYQKSYRVSDMAKVLGLVDYGRDTWISQSEFNRPNRRVVNLARVGLLFSDLDTYKSESMRHMSLDAQIQHLHFHCAENGIPPPSLIVFSGRGLQAKWLLDCALPRAALPRWNACQKALQILLTTLGSDRKAKDASRVLRLVDSIHSISKARVEVVDVQGPVSNPAQYNFDELADCLLPFTREELQIKRQRKSERDARLKLVSENPKAANFRGFNGRVLAWARLEDIRKLGEIRGGWIDSNGVSDRTLALHWQMNFLCLSGAATPSNFSLEATELARQIDDSWSFSMDELGTLRDKALAYCSGKPIHFGERQWPALYTPKNQTLIDLFGITDAEQRQLKTIITPDIARERNTTRQRIKRRAEGVLERSEYDDKRKQEATNRAEQIKALKAQGLSAAAIAKKMNVTTRTVFNALKLKGEG